MTFEMTVWAYAQYQYLYVAVGQLFSSKAQKMKINFQQANVFNKKNSSFLMLIKLATKIEIAL